MVVILAEKVAGPNILDVQPAVRERGDRSLKFPEVLEAGVGVILYVDPRAGTRLIAVDIENFAVEGIGDNVRRNVPETSVSYLAHARTWCPPTRSMVAQISAASIVATVPRDSDSHRPNLLVY